ncbi:hypothetical protein KBI33_03735 [Candidatus Shapirobacteria bacterium]|nr:hypothetical protein [Candidatus Shapirobacteria bacterium]
MPKERGFFDHDFYNYCYSLEEFEYWGLLETVGENWRDELEREYAALAGSSELFRDKQYCLILPGSDGKKERHTQSKTEIILLLEESNFSLEKEIEKKAEAMSRENSTLGFVETKIVGSNETPLSFFEHSPSRVYPDRVLNSHLLAGDRQLYLRARRQVLGEMTDKKIKEAMRSQLKQYKKVIRTGEYRNLKVFSKEKGEQYYFENHETNRIRFGFKVGFLRAVQRKLDLETVRWLESGKEGVDFLAQNLPTSTMERIDYFAQRGLFDKNFALNLQRAYLWFLKNYHYAQETFSRDKSRVAVVSFDRERFAAGEKVIIAFVNGQYSYF